MHAYPYTRAVDLDALAEHARELTSRTYTEGLVHGNASPDMARACLEQMVRSLATFPLPSTERELQQLARLDAGFIFADAHSNPDDLNHALELYLQAPSVGLRQVARLE